MLSAALRAWANLLIGWENPRRGSYWSVQPPITTVGVHTTVQGNAVSCLTPDGRSILWPGVTLRSHDSVWFVNWCCLVFVLPVIMLSLDFESVPSGSPQLSLMLILLRNIKAINEHMLHGHTAATAADKLSCFLFASLLSLSNKY